MKTTKAILVFLVIMLSANVSFAQNLTADTTHANEYYEMADSCLKTRQLDSALFYAQKAQKLYIKHLGEKSLKNSNCLNTIGAVNYYASKYDDALEYYLKSLEINLGIYGENHASIANSYNLIGVVYWRKSEYDKALEYLYKSLEIRLENFGENHPSVANLYNNIGLIYANKPEYDKALEYHFKSLKIRLNVFSKNNTSVADSYYNIGIVYRQKSEYDKALEYYFKSLKIFQEILGEKHPYIADLYGNIGSVYTVKAEYDKALEYFFKSLKITRETFGENHPSVAGSYGSIGNVYLNKSEYDKALEYYFKSLEIFKEILSDKHPYVADTYSNIGIVYAEKSEYDKALEYYYKSLEIKLEIYNDKHPLVATTYSNIGIIYEEKSEYDKALEYYFKSLEIRLVVFGEKHPHVAISYSNIGIIYEEKSEYDKALKYFFKSLDIRLEIFGKNHPSVANSYNNIGLVYADKSEYDKALEYYFESLEISLGIFGKKHPSVADSYNNIGLVYANKSKYNKALEYYYKSLEVDLEIHGEKHPDVANSYYNIGNVYTDKGEYNVALEYYQKGVASCLRNFNDTSHVDSVPVIEDYLDWNDLLEALHKKAKVFAHHAKDLTDLEEPSGLELALRHYQACDTLIGLARREISTKSDKLALGEKIVDVYLEAVDVCMKLSEKEERENSDRYKELAFYFSEKNKSSVLLEALAGAEAQKFAGIADSLLQKENELQTDMALYKKLLAENPDSAKQKLFNDKLFTANREYEALIKMFENEYPEYFKLKYNQEPIGVVEIKNRLDAKTAMISYLKADSTITIFTITHDNLDIKTVTAMDNFADTIQYYRYGLIYTTSLRYARMYKKYAYRFYQKLIPYHLSGEIENLIIIPEAGLSMIPFETFLTEEAEDKDWKELSYLIKKFNISYSYSANLFYKTFPKETDMQVETTDLNDWLAFAPVFDDSNTAGLTLRTRELLQAFDSEMDDTLGTRGRLMEGDYISPLPGTESEVEAIFREFDEKGKKALVQIKKKANEDFVKSGQLADYKYLHFATHGFVNTDKPELSGIFLAQDSALTEDGILYQGEIYNLDMNADLTVLSACETGLGKIRKGEGLIGLTRALLYAGSKNIIVSLWRVSDESTSDLMIGFYKNLLEENKDQKEFSKALKQAKLKLINEGSYAHPFYWSPFILIGK